MKTSLEKNNIYVVLKGSNIKMSLNVFNNQYYDKALKDCIQKN